MKINLVFDHWSQDGISLNDRGFNDDEVWLFMGSFHGGTTFHGTIDLDDEDAEELMEAMRKGYRPTFWISP